MTLGFAVAPVRGHAAALLRSVDVDVERPADGAAAGREGVPVALPVRDGSPGGSYGTAAEWHALCPAMFPLEVLRRDGDASDEFGGARRSAP